MRKEMTNLGREGKQLALLYFLSKSGCSLEVLAKLLLKPQGA